MGFFDRLFGRAPAQPKNPRSEGPATPALRPVTQNPPPRQSLPSSNACAPLASKIANTIRLLVNACYNTQLAVYRCRRPSKQVLEGLSALRSGLLSLLDDRSTTPSNPRADIVWVFSQAQGIAQDMTYAANKLSSVRSPQELMPLLTASVGRVKRSRASVKELQVKHARIVTESKIKVETIDAYLRKEQSQSDDTLGGPKARPNDNGRALVATAPLPTSRNGTWATNILTIPDGLITLKEITTLQATLTEDLRSFNEFWSDQENVLALVSSQQLVMTMAEARNYIKGWEDAGIASRDATKTIKLAYDAYPTQSKG